MDQSQFPRDYKNICRDNKCFIKYGEYQFYCIHCKLSFCPVHNTQENHLMYNCMPLFFHDMQPVGDNTIPLRLPKEEQKKMEESAALARALDAALKLTDSIGLDDFVLVSKDDVNAVFLEFEATSGMDHVVPLITDAIGDANSGEVAEQELTEEEQRELENVFINEDFKKITWWGKK